MLLISGIKKDSSSLNTTFQHTHTWERIQENLKDQGKKNNWEKKNNTNMIN